MIIFVGGGVVNKRFINFQDVDRETAKERAWNKFDNYNAELLFQTGSPHKAHSHLCPGMDCMQKMQE